MYRIWRQLPDGSETLLNNLKDTIVYNQNAPNGIAWQTNYSPLRDTYPGNNVNGIVDYFVYDAIAADEELEVKYIVRLYTELTEPITLPTRGNRDSDSEYGLAENEDPAKFDNGTPTGIADVNMDSQVADITYYNAVGMRSDKPFDGINIVVVRFHDGSVNTYKTMN